MEMKKYKLGEIVTVLAGGTPSTKIDKYWNGSIPWLSVKDFCSVNKWVSSTEKTITQEGFDNCPSSMLKKGDLILSARGTVGKIAMADKNMAFNQSCFGLRAKMDFVTSDFLFYWFLNNQQIFKGAQQGNVFKSITLDFFEKTNAIIPPLPTQQKIAAILSSLDDKIALNKKINAKLETMAKRLYDYWFVQFDFPNGEGKPYKSSGGKMVWNEVLKREIPEGWEVKRLGELFITNRGVSYSTKTITGDVGIPMINLASFSPDGSYKIDGIKLYTGDYSQEKVLKPFDLVMCNTQQTAIDFSKDIIGKALLIPDIFEGDITSSHHVNTLKVHDEKLKFYLYRLFNTDYFHAYISHFASGTNIMGLDFAGVENYTAVIPSDEILSKFADFTLNIEKKKSEIIRENKKLTDLRDRLLPLLMNGQVEVGTNNSSEFCNEKLGKKATACDMNGQVEVEG